MKCIAILQARMGSTRLPGKVLMDIEGKPILQRAVERVRLSKKTDRVVIATTTNSEDDPIEVFCQTHQIDCSRGSDWDVLDRYYQAALAFGAGEEDHIVRICCDNPLISPDTVDFVLGKHLLYGTDYFSNSNQEPLYLEDGFDTEVCRFTALERAAREANLLSQREHVMPYIKNSGHFSCGWQKSHSGYTFKLSVDTPADLELVRTIYRELGPGLFGITEVVDLLRNKPELLDINRDSSINSGYFKSLKEDRIVK